MSKYNPQKPWLARVLIPFWTLQLIIAGLLIIVSSYAISLVEHYDDYTGRAVFSVSAVILLAFSALSFVLVLAEMIAYCIRSLNPLAFLISNVLKTAIWTVYLCIGIISAAMEYSIVDVIIAIVYFLIFLGSLIYASVIYHRCRMSTKYSPVSPQNQQPSTSSNPGTNIPADYYATETAYNAHGDSRTFTDTSELQFYGSNAHGSVPEHHDRTSISMPNIQVTNPLTSGELDVEAQAALHNDYRRSITIPRGYEPVRMHVHEMGEASSSSPSHGASSTTAAAHGSDVSPLAESQGYEHHDPTASSPSSIYSVPVSPLVITKKQPERSNSLDDMIMNDKASMGGLIKLATHAEE